MRDLPCPFRAPLIHALQREIACPGTGKTQTRRPMPARLLISTARGRPVVQGADGVYRSPPTRYKVGDRLWVREAWRTEARFDRLPPRDLQPGSLVSYEADYDGEPNDGCRGRLRPGMFMPRWASRITLTVTGARVERLQDISEADAIAEGIQAFGSWFHIEKANGLSAMGTSAKAAYALLWNSINGPGAWDRNPWITAYTFTVEHRNIDAGGASNA